MKVEEMGKAQNLLDQLIADLESSIAFDPNGELVPLLEAQIEAFKLVKEKIVAPMRQRFPTYESVRKSLLKAGHLSPSDILIRRRLNEVRDMWVTEWLD